MVTNTSGLTTITVRNEIIEIKFGLPACQAFSAMCIADDSEKYIIGTKLQALGLAKLLLAGYENNCLVRDITPKYTLGTFMEFIEDTLIDNPAEAARIVQVFADSRYTQKLLEEADKINQAVEEAKKKLTGNLSNLSPSTSLVSRKDNTMNVPSGSLSSVKKGTNAMKPKKRKPKSKY